MPKKTISAAVSDSQNEFISIQNLLLAAEKAAAWAKFKHNHGLFDTSTIWTNFPELFKEDYAYPQYEHKNTQLLFTNFR